MAEKITLQDLDNAPPSVGSEPAQFDQDAFDKMHAAFTRISEEKAAIQNAYDKLKSDTNANTILNRLIEPFANKTFIFMCAYCGFVGLIILMNSFKCFKQPISDDVMQILVGSTAATVIGLVGMVLTGIFVGARRKDDN